MTGFHFEAGTVGFVVIAAQFVLPDFYEPVLAEPDVSIFRESDFQRIGEPGLVGLAGFVDGANNTGQKWRLRAGEIIAAVSIWNLSIALDLVKEIVGNAAREITTSILKEAENNKITVPTIQFVEPSAGHDIGHAAERFAVGIQF